MTFRSRALLNLAHRVNECTNCGRYVPEGMEPAHENGIEAGKGFGNKAHDARHAALCHDCHAFYDQGGTGRDPSGLYTATKADKAEMWLRAHRKTFDLYWERQWLKVA
jgi:hypothetical protein